MSELREWEDEAPTLRDFTEERAERWADANRDDPGFCDAPIDGTACDLPVGHDGAHQALLGGAS
jgi:hypothetical protein